MPRNYAADELDRLSQQNKGFAETSRKYFADRVQADFYEGEAQFHHNLAEILRLARRREAYADLIRPEPL